MAYRLERDESLAVGLRRVAVEQAEAAAEHLADRKEAEAESFTELRREILELARQGITLSRFKGLGEMNAEQLWETTMDPTRRTLMQVQLEDVAAANDLFTTLMGDDVEPRREFIEKHALEVKNLDV